MRKIVFILLGVLLVVSLSTVAVFALNGEGEPPVCDATLQGYQNQIDGYDVRIVAEVSNLDAYREVGLVLSNGTDKIWRAASCVFSTLTATDTTGRQYEALTAEEGSYLFALTVKGIGADDAFTWTVAPYTVSTAGKTVVGTEKTLLKAKGNQFTKAVVPMVTIAELDGTPLATVAGLSAVYIAGDKVSFTAEAVEGYHIGTVTVNGETVTPVEGVYAYTLPADVGQLKDLTIQVDAAKHDWQYTYAWSDLTCTAKRTCPDCGEDETESVDGTLQRVVHPATKTAVGKAAYSATFASADFNTNADQSIVENHLADIPVNTPFALTTGGKQSYAFADVIAGKYYYVEVRLSAPVATGYVGLAHMDPTATAETLFYDMIALNVGGNYQHLFSSTVAGTEKAQNVEPAAYFEGKTLKGLTGADFAADGMTFATLRAGGLIYAFVNNVRIATYQVEDAIADADTVPMLYFINNGQDHYDGQVNDVEVVTDKSKVESKLSALTNGHDGFSYVNYGLWAQYSGHGDATFNEDGGFTYRYDASVSGNDRRFLNGVTDRVFLTGNYYYQYEISGDMSWVNASNVYGLFYNWINTKQAASGVYSHEAVFCLKKNNSDQLERLRFDAGKGAGGDGAGGWSCGTGYGGNSSLASNADWQAAYKGGLIIRIERTAVNATTDSYVISVTSKTDPSVQLVSQPIEVTGATFGGYNWIVFGTQSIDCTISDVKYGRL